jgi:hypothetical protein
MASVALAVNGLVHQNVLFPYGLDVSVRALFDRNSFSGRALTFGNILCNVSASLADVVSAASVPSYSSQTLSIDVIWVSSAWPLFSDIVIETDARIGSIWTPPSQWLQVSAALVAATNASVGYANGIHRTLQQLASNLTTNEHVPLWRLQGNERLSVISHVSRSPSIDSPFSFALSKGEMIVTLIADKGFWLTAAPDADQTIRGPFTKDTVVSVARKKCLNTWVAPNGRAIRVTIPSLAAWCAASTGMQRRNCVSMPFTVSKEGMPDVVLANLAHLTDTGSLTLSRGMDSVLSLQTSAMEIEGTRPLAATISCPPFCPGGPTYLLEPFVKGSDWASRNNVSSARVSSMFFLSSQLLENVEFGLSLGFYFSDGCEHLGYEPFLTGPEKFTWPCMNKTSGAFCAFLNDGVCTPCPFGALCPGQAYVLPTAGFWSAGFPTDPSVERCPPPSTVRCPGFNISRPSLTCGVGYSGLRCAACSKGYYDTVNDSTGSRFVYRAILEARSNTCPQFTLSSASLAWAVLPLSHPGWLHVGMGAQPWTA